MTGLFTQIFLTFFFIGLLNFGGGGAMISLIQGQVVETHGWLTEAAFTDIVGISQSTPGPIAINCATYTGYEVIHKAGGSVFLSTMGSATATLAVILPSFLILFLILRIFNRFNTSPVFKNTMKALKPAVGGLIGAAAIMLTFRIYWNGNVPEAQIIQENFPNWKAWLTFGCAFILCYKKILGPIAIIIASGVIGLMIY